jgi:hypothetical protein
VKQALAFVERHGVVLQSARGPVPSLAHAIAGGPFRGSWWGHPKSHQMFNIFTELHDNPAICVCRLIGGKVTYVHERLWAPLARLAGEIGAARLTRLREEHTASGAHRTIETPLSRWLPEAVRAAAKRLSEAEARAALSEIPL